MPSLFNPLHNIFEKLEDPDILQKLPNVAPVVKSIASLNTQGNDRLEDLCRVMDTPTSKKVLGIANSSFYCPTDPISEVKDAIMYMGLNTLRGAVSSMRCMEMTANIQQEHLNWANFWIHSAGVAFVATELAQRLPRHDFSVESYYLTGLLHDVGKPLLAFIQPEEFNRIYHPDRDKKIPLSTRETELIGMDHAQIGAWYLRQHGLPMGQTEPIRLHHKTTDNVQARIIRLADNMVRYQCMGDAGNHCPIGEDPFDSEDWTWFTQACHMLEKNSSELRSSVNQSLAKTSKLVRITVQ